MKRELCEVGALRSFITETNLGGCLERHPMRLSFAELWTNMQEATKNVKWHRQKRKEEVLRQKEFRSNFEIFYLS